MHPSQECSTYCHLFVCTAFTTGAPPYSAAKPMRRCTRQGGFGEVGPLDPQRAEGLGLASPPAGYAPNSSISNALCYVRSVLLLVVMKARSY